MKNNTDLDEKSMNISDDYACFEFVAFKECIKFGDKIDNIHYHKHFAVFQILKEKKYQNVRTASDLYVFVVFTRIENTTNRFA